MLSSRVSPSTAIVVVGCGPTTAAVLPLWLLLCGKERGQWSPSRLNVGGVQIDAAVADAFPKALEPAGLEAALAAARQVEEHHAAALGQWRLAVERAQYEADRAERRYCAVEPENLLVARGLETEWEHRLCDLDHAKTEFAVASKNGPARWSLNRSATSCASESI